ncbi:RNA methyltransferase-like protein 1 [Mactra antiquata]
MYSTNTVENFSDILLYRRQIMYARGRSKRQENKEIVLEGKNLIVDALMAGARMKVLYFAGSDVLDDIPASLIGDADVYKVRYNDLKLWSDVVTPQGLLGIFELPTTDVPLQPASNPIPFTLICDSIRDAGNMGTLIRTAAAVGCQKFIATKGCVDIWNGKVLRSAVGGHFRVPIISNVTWPQIPGILPSSEDINVLIADNNKSVFTTSSLSAVDRIEQLKERNMFQHSNDISENLVNDDNDDDDDDDDGDYYYDTVRKEKKRDIKSVDLVEDDSYKDFELLNAYTKAPLKVDMYDTVDYTERHPVLIISGETTGISLPARKLAYDHFGRLVNIPMVDGIDSLNCTIAGSVIMYEISRQYRTQRNDSDED